MAESNGLHLRIVLLVLCCIAIAQARHSAKEVATTARQVTLFKRWKNCFDGTGDLDPISAQVEYIASMGHHGSPGIKLTLVAQLVQSNDTSVRVLQRTNSTFYQFEMYHKDTGAKIQYKGPYDACCGFMEHSQCAEHVTTPSSPQSDTTGGGGGRHKPNSDCPVAPGTVFKGVVTRPLHRELPGMWEATLLLFDYEWNSVAGRQVKNELLCIDVPFELVPTTRSEAPGDPLSQVSLFEESSESAEHH